MNDVLLCKAIADKQNVVFEAPKLTATELLEIIQEDKKYGIFRPRNGKYFTYKALNHDIEISEKTILKGMMISTYEWAFKISYAFRRISKDQESDFKLEFRTTSEDPELTSNTIMYHYFPINDLDDPRRGLCVANSDFFFTVTGNPVDMHLIDPTHYPEPSPTNPLGIAYDFDKIYRHELGHGLGLAHIMESGHLMSPNEGDMSEHASNTDGKRATAKYTARSWPSFIVQLWKSNYRRWSESY